MSPAPLENSCRSWPTQKPRPAPVITTARTDGFSASRNAAWIPRCIAPLSAFSTSGRLSVIVKTAPARETSTSAIAQDLNRTRVRPVNNAYDAYPSLELDRPAPHVLRLTLRAPGKLNAVSGTMHGELAAVWRTIADDDETHAVLVRGADGAFSAGGDLDLVLEIANDHATRQRVFHEARDLVYNVIDCPKPIVSAMTGHAIGAGLAVGLLADVSIATPNARIVDGHTKLGVAAGDHAAIVWPLLCGMAKAKYHLLLCEPVDGVEAERIGLVSLCVPEAELDRRLRKPALVGVLARGHERLGRRSRLERVPVRELPLGAVTVRRLAHR